MSVSMRMEAVNKCALTLLEAFTVLAPLDIT